MCLVGSEGSTILGVDEECHRVAEEALAFGALPDVEGVGVAGEGLIIKVAHFLRNNFISLICGDSRRALRIILRKRVQRASGIMRIEAEGILGATGATQVLC